MVIEGTLSGQHSISTYVNRLMFLPMQDFIPSFCCSMQDYSHFYEEPWKYNLLGLPPDVEVPDDIDTDLYVIIGVVLLSTLAPSKPAEF